MNTIEKALQKNKEKQQEEKKTSLEAAQDKSREQQLEAQMADQQQLTNQGTGSSETVKTSDETLVETSSNGISASSEEAMQQAMSGQTADDLNILAPDNNDDSLLSTNLLSQGTTSTRRDRFIPLTNIQKDGFVSNIERNTINEEYRAIKRKVLGNAFGPLAKTLNNANIIMVTSPNPNEGKTFTAINLALSIALEQDKTVLLVDADVLRPSVMKTIDQPFENGLMEYLLGEIDDIGEVMHHTSLDTLRIIPAGKTHHLSTELLASEKMLESVSEFAHRYQDRVVIIDSPPLLGINETAILANLAGQAVVVVHEGKTSLNRVAQAVENLNPDMAKGFVINKAKKSASDSAGYYGYYYGYED